jgi:hypothetical protein
MAGAGAGSGGGTKRILDGSGGGREASSTGDVPVSALAIAVQRKRKRVNRVFMIWNAKEVILPSGRGVERVATGRPRWTLAELPEGRRLGHTPPPPRPFNRFGTIVAVDADRLLGGFSHPHPL